MYTSVGVPSSIRKKCKWDKSNNKIRIGLSIKDLHHVTQTPPPPTPHPKKKKKKKKKITDNIYTWHIYIPLLCVIYVYV